MRLIDADVANKWIKRNNAFIDPCIMKAIPTIDPLDALGICRCKDCIYSKKIEKDDEFAYCYYWEYEEGLSPNVVELDGFCSNAEKRIQ